MQRFDSTHHRRYTLKLLQHICTVYWSLHLTIKLSMPSFLLSGNICHYVWGHCTLNGLKAQHKQRGGCQHIGLLATLLLMNDSACFRKGEKEANREEEKNSTNSFHIMCPYRAYWTWRSQRGCGSSWECFLHSLGTLSSHSVCRRTVRHLVYHRSTCASSLEAEAGNQGLDYPAGTLHPSPSSRHPGILQARWGRREWAVPGSLRSCSVVTGSHVAHLGCCNRCAWGGDPN